MLVELTWLVATLSSGAAGGVALAHVLEVPGKRELPGEIVATVQQGLYPGFRIFGMIVEPVALVSTVVLIVLLIGEDAAFWLVLVAVVAVVGMGAVFPLLTQPMNRRIAEWRPGAMPQNWRRTLALWTFSHGLRAGLLLVTVTSLVLAALLDGPS